VSSQFYIQNRAKWRTVLWLALAELLAMSLWFSVSAITPALSEAWTLSTGEVAWLTMSVQIGFVVGTFLSALTNAADVWPPRAVFAIGAIIGGLANALIVAVDSLGPALLLRFITGFSLAAVYPVGMKILATWMKTDRGLGLGLLVGALTIGSASPHLFRAFGGLSEWRSLLLGVSVLAFIAAGIGWRVGKLGPHQVSRAVFRWQYLVEGLRDRGVRLANYGYLGHMWELYAMWTWIPLFLLESFRANGSLPNGGAELAASVVAFAAIAMGGLGSLLAGRLADRWGRSRTASLSMVISGTCAVSIGFFFGANPWIVSAIALVWGLAVVADSAQFSTAVSELSEAPYMGTALTLQTSMGFLLTLVSIRLVPVLQAWLGWTGAFAILALGPLLGVIAMQQLQRSPAAAHLAGGRG
jgi:MFS family permease